MRVVVRGEGGGGGGGAEVVSSRRLEVRRLARARARACSSRTRSVSRGTGSDAFYVDENFSLRFGGGGAVNVVVAFAAELAAAAVSPLTISSLQKLKKRTVQS